MRRPLTLQPFPVVGANETRQFLTEHSATDNELMRELWNISSGLPGLLVAHQPDTAPPPLLRGEREYIYDARTGKYRRVSDGRTVSEREIRRAVFKTTTEAKNRIRTETQQMMAGGILFYVWYHRMRSIMKAMFRAIWVVTLGGVLFEDDDGARNAFYLWVILFFDKLDSFKIAIETGATPFDGHIRTVAGTLARSGNGAYQNAKLDIGRRKGHTEARRILGENENHCRDSEDKPGCIELAELGWMPISRIVPIGDATCRGNCMCQIETRKRI